MQTVPERSRYRGPIVGLGGSALAAAVIGLLFGPISRAFLSEELQGEVIVLAIPFVGYFAAIILLFILAVALIGQRFHQAVPARTHRPVEFTTIAGILIGIVALFQPLDLSPYRYGFSVLLYATLAFILWSHVAPRRDGEDASLPDFTPRATLIARSSGLLITALLVVGLALSARPAEPYGLRQRRWDAMREEQQQEVIASAQRNYRFITLPALLVYSALPGFAAFFLIREIATPKTATGRGAERGADDGELPLGA